MKNTEMNFIQSISKSFPVLVIFILLNITVTFSQQKSPAPDTLRYKQNPLYSQMLSLYDVYKPRQVDIIMLGNSLTHGASWNDLLGRPSIIEMGIPSDVLRGYIARVNYVLLHKPKIVFIMGGLNDIYNWTPVEDIFKVYTRLINELRSKNIAVVIQSTTYAARNYGKEYGGTPESNAGRNREVDKLNKLLSDYAKNNKLDYIDLLPLITRAGYLKDELSWDGLHFRAEAYQLWGREVEKILQKYRL
jgi:lysophospholipase L1-like esterase